MGDTKAYLSHGELRGILVCIIPPSYKYFILCFLFRTPLHIALFLTPSIHATFRWDFSSQLARVSYEFGLIAENWTVLSHMRTSKIFIPMGSHSVENSYLYPYRICNDLFLRGPTKSKIWICWIIFTNPWNNENTQLLIFVRGVFFQEHCFLVNDFLRTSAITRGRLPITRVSVPNYYSRTGPSHYGDTVVNCFKVLWLLPVSVRHPSGTQILHFSHFAHTKMMIASRLSHYEPRES